MVSVPQRARKGVGPASRLCLVVSDSRPIGLEEWDQRVHIFAHTLMHFNISCDGPPLLKSVTRPLSSWFGCKKDYKIIALFSGNRCFIKHTIYNIIYACSIIISLLFVIIVTQLFVTCHGWRVFLLICHNHNLDIWLLSNCHGWSDET